jgi:drug/metabolite transporter (DMT)-like permease
VYLSFSGELVRLLGSLRLVGLATSVACVLCIGQFVLLLGEPFSAWMAAGTVCVVTGIFVFTSCPRQDA